MTNPIIKTLPLLMLKASTRLRCLCPTTKLLYFLEKRRIIYLDPDSSKTQNSFEVPKVSNLWWGPLFPIQSLCLLVYWGSYHFYPLVIEFASFVLLGMLLPLHSCENVDSYYRLTQIS